MLYSISYLINYLSEFVDNFISKRDERIQAVQI